MGPRGTLAVLRLAPRFADSNAMDRFDFAVREQIPNAGLGALKALADGPGSASAGRQLDRRAGRNRGVALVRAYAEGLGGAAAAACATCSARRRRESAARPRDWEFGAARRRRSTFSTRRWRKRRWRSEPGGEMPLEEFWRAVKSVLRLKPLRAGGRTAQRGPRARARTRRANGCCRWCSCAGMVEKQFPQFHRAGPVLPGRARRQACIAAGIRVRTAAEFEREERALFDSAISAPPCWRRFPIPSSTRAASATCPRCYLEDLRWRRSRKRGGRPAAALSAHANARRQRTSARPALLAFSGARRPRGFRPPRSNSICSARSSISAGALCASKTPPCRPEERLDFLTQGNIVHEVLAAWWQHRQGDRAPLFEDVFARIWKSSAFRAAITPSGCATPCSTICCAFAARYALAARPISARARKRSSTSPLERALEITGKIDRLDEAADGRAYVIDYKYSNAQNTTDRAGRRARCCKRRST